MIDSLESTSRDRNRPLFRESPKQRYHFTLPDVYAALREATFSGYIMQLLVARLGPSSLGPWIAGHPSNGAATEGMTATACGIARRNGAYYSIGMQTISLKLPDDLLAELANEAKARRVTKSALVRDSLEKALRKEPRAGAVSCYDMARDLAGTIKGLPKDLADNPKYMEDFGK